jgi:hypothetical protein
MAPVTRSGYGDLPPSGGGRRKRWWLIGLVVAWILVVAGAGVWSVGHERASVPEQRDIGQALPELQKAAGVVFAAAGGPGRAIELGDLALAKGCRVTPVRAGVAAVREVTVQVRSGEAHSALEAIAEGLPGGYRADVSAGRGGTEFSLHADAGNFIGIDSAVKATAPALTLRVSSGCRPLGSHGLDRADPAARAVPGSLNAVLAALGAQPVAFPSTGAAASAGSGITAAVRAVACPDGRVAGTFVADGVAAPGDLVPRLRRVSSDADVVRDDDSVHAFRIGDDSVVVVPDGSRLRVSVSTPC